MFWPFAMGARNEHQEEQNNIITRISLSSGVAIALAVAAWLPSSAAEKNEKEANDYTRSVACPFAQVLNAEPCPSKTTGFLPNKPFRATPV